MREKEIEILERLLSHIGQNYDKLPDKPLTGFLAMIGHRYEGELMVVGRAVNGWENSWRPRELAENRTIRKVSRDILSNSINETKCPMLWVSEKWGSGQGGNSEKRYNSKKSAFWRVIRHVVDRLNLADVDDVNWPSILTWTNLYKIAPNDKGGNPSPRLIGLQLEYCQELLDLEFSQQKPRRILFLTGYDYWAKRFPDNRVEQLREVSPGVYAAIKKYTSGDTGKIVVASHPQCKKESTWVEEVIKAFGT